MVDQYRYNTETAQIVLQDGALGAAFFKSPWRDATSAEADAYLLQEAKITKTRELNRLFTAFECGGHVYDGNTYCLTQAGMDNIQIVNNLDPSDPNAYTFRTVDGIVHDFENQTAWDAFKLNMMTERNRIMVYRIAKKSEIEACSTIAEVEAVVIDFSA